MENREPIEVECWIVDDQPTEKPRKRRLPAVIRYMNQHPILWIWVWMITVVGLTEGLW